MARWRFKACQSSVVAGSGAGGGAVSAIKELAKLLEGVKICFCTLCSHNPDYGHCYACRCGNHVPEPAELDAAEIGKLKEALTHWRNHAIEFARRREH